MKKITTLTDVIEILCCADRYIGRKEITISSMIQMGKLAEKEKTA